MLYTIDFKSGGKGVAIGKPATSDNLFEVNFPTRFTGGIDYVYIPSGQNLNNYKTPGFYYNPRNTEVANISNTPVNDAFTLEVSKHAGVKQTFTRYNYDQPRTWMRNYFNGTWGAWFEIVLANQFNGYFDNRMNATFDSKFNNRIHKKLWTGTLKKGQTVNVPNFSKYKLVACQPGSDGILLVGYKNGGTTGQVHLSAGTGAGGWYNVSFKYNGDSVTYSDGGNILTNIIGII